ncbi:MAG: glycosyltransferase, partial [Steroidobacteraceae bacterium]
MSSLKRPVGSSARAPRIYWITEEFPPDCGAIGFVVERLAVSLEQRGFAVNVIARQTRPPSPRYTRNAGVSVRRIRPAGRLKGAGWRALPPMAAFLARLVWLLTSEARRYDVVVLSGMKTMPVAVVPVCRALGKACVIRLESPFELLEPIAAESLGRMGGACGVLSGARRLLSRALAWLLGVLQRAAVARADRIVAISSELVERLCAAGCRPSRIAQIPNATDLERFVPVAAPAKQALREQLGLPCDRTLALYAGRLSRAKGVLM